MVAVSDFWFRSLSNYQIIARSEVPGSRLGKIRNAITQSHVAPARGEILQSIVRPWAVCNVFITQDLLEEES